MARTQLILIGIVLAEVIAAWHMMPQPDDVVPPLPDLQYIESVTADEIRGLHAKATDGDVDDWRELGEACLVSGFFPEAELSLRYCAQRDSTDYGIQELHGMALNQIGRTSEAIGCFRRAAALATGRDRQRCWYHVGRNFLREENPAEAERAFRNAGDLMTAEYELARLRIRTGRGRETIEPLDRLVVQYPDEQLFYQLRARARAELGNVAGASEDRLRAERAKLRLPTDLIVYFLQGHVTEFGHRQQVSQCQQAIAEGNVDGTAARLRAMLDADWSEWASALLVGVEIQLGNGQEAVDLLTLVGQRMGDTPENLSRLGDAWQLQGDIEKARSYRERAVTHNFNAPPGVVVDTRPWRSLSDYHTRNGDNAQANYFRARDLEFDALREYEVNNLESASALFEQALAADPDISRAWYYLGETRLALGKASEARDAFEQCLSRQPNHGRAVAALERCLVAANNDAE